MEVLDITADPLERDRKRFAIGTLAGDIQVWTIDNKGMTQVIVSVSFHPSVPHKLAFGRDNELVIFGHRVGVGLKVMNIKPFLKYIVMVASSASKKGGLSESSGWKRHMREYQKTAKDPKLTPNQGDTLR